MSLKGNLDQIEHFFGKTTFKDSKRRKWYKKVRNKWLRLHDKEEIPNTKLRKGWEY